MVMKCVRGGGGRFLTKTNVPVSSFLFLLLMQIGRKEEKGQKEEKGRRGEAR